MFGVDHIDTYRDAPVTIATLPANVIAAGAATTFTSVVDIDNVLVIRMNE
jgi:hypothetical protein